MQSRVIKNLKELDDFAKFFVKHLPVSSKKAVVVGLAGELGSGKTTFTQTVAKIFGIKGYITSPTFVIQKKYKIILPQNNFENLIHLDAYRLGSGKELRDLGWEEITQNPKNIIFLEWPEKVCDILDEQVIFLHFEFLDETTREIKILNSNL